MTINNYKQKATGHVTSLANGHFTGSDAPFVCEIPTASSNIKRYNFADIGLAVGTSISNAFSASFTSIWPSFPRFYCSPNEASLM